MAEHKPGGVEAWQADLETGGWANLVGCGGTREQATGEALSFLYKCLAYRGADRLELLFHVHSRIEEDRLRTLVWFCDIHARKVR